MVAIAMVAIFKISNAPSPVCCKGPIDAVSQATPACDAVLMFTARTVVARDVLDGFDSPFSCSMLRVVLNSVE